MLLWIWILCGKWWKLMVKCLWWCLSCIVIFNRFSVNCYVILWISVLLCRVFNDECVLICVNGMVFCCCVLLLIWFCILVFFLFYGLVFIMNWWFGKVKVIIWIIELWLDISVCLVLILVLILKVILLIWFCYNCCGEVFFVIFWWGKVEINIFLFVGILMFLLLKLRKWECGGLGMRNVWNCWRLNMVLSVWWIDIVGWFYVSGCLIWVMIEFVRVIEV